MKGDGYGYMDSSIIDLGVNGVQAQIDTVGDTTSVFDTDGQRFRVVPGYDGEEFAMWGDDNLLPYVIKELIEGDEVTAQNKLTNVLTCYGSGLEFVDVSTGVATRDPVVRRWFLGQCFPKYFLEQITSMKFYYFSVCVLILSADGSRVNRIVHKDSASCRFGRADQHGRIGYVYFGDWSSPSMDRVERISLLDELDPLGDLERRFRSSGPSREKERKFAIVCRFPTVTNAYYPFPYYASIFRGGSYDEKRMISAGKRAKLRNSSSVKYLIEVERGYWSRLLELERITDPVLQKARIKQEKQNMRDFMLGLHNSGKAWITAYYVNPDGKEVHDVRIVNIETSKEGGDWADDMTAATNTLCYADNVHPNLVGAVPGKSGMNNSGSDKRELFTMKQALETAFHDLLLLPLEVVCYFNGWSDVFPRVPMIQLSTLDEHRDAQLVSVNDKM